MVEKRDAQFGISTKEIRERRASMGYAVPEIPPPRSIEELGRRWKAEGADEPTRTGAGK